MLPNHFCPASRGKTLRITPAVVANVSGGCASFVMTTVLSVFKSKPTRSNLPHASCDIEFAALPQCHLQLHRIVQNTHTAKSIRDGQEFPHQQERSIMLANAPGQIQHQISCEKVFFWSSSWTKPMLLFRLSCFQKMFQSSKLKICKCFI